MGDWDTQSGIDAGQRPALDDPHQHALALTATHRCRKITVANQKGGVGKTTSAVNLAWGLSLQGFRVLVIDLDPQGNASTALGADHRLGTPSSYEVLIGEASVTAAIQGNPHNPNIFCIPATIDLAGAEVEMVGFVRREFRLSDALNPSILARHGFDFVFIDCPPSLGLLTINAMTAVDEVLIPIQCEYYALEGVGQLLNNINLIRQSLNPALHISAVLLTMYDARTKLSEQVSEEVRSHFGSVVLDNRIPRSVKVSEAPGYGQTVIQYDPSSTGARAYYDASVELGRRGDYLPTPETTPIGIAPELHNL